MKVRDLLGHERQAVIDYCVEHGLDEAQAEARIESMLDLEEWEINARAKISYRLAVLMQERNTDDDPTATVAELIGEQELKTIITEEMNAARQHSRDLN